MAKAKRRKITDLQPAARPVAHALTKDQRDQIDTALRINDDPGDGRYYPLAAVHALLAEEYGLRMGKTALQRIVCREWGRRSWGVK